MGTKQSPSVYDCHGDALPDEPLFTLLARDPQAPKLVRQWARERADMVALGAAPILDANKVSEAYELAQKMEVWRAKRRNNNQPLVEGEDRGDYSHDLEKPKFLRGGSPGFRGNLETYVPTDDNKSPPTVFRNHGDSLPMSPDDERFLKKSAIHAAMYGSGKSDHEAKS